MFTLHVFPWQHSICVPLFCRERVKYLSPGLQATLVMEEPRRGRNCLLWASSCHSTRTDSSPPERRYVPGWGVRRVGGWRMEK